MSYLQKFDFRRIPRQTLRRLTPRLPVPSALSAAFISSTFPCDPIFRSSLPLPFPSRLRSYVYVGEVCRLVRSRQSYARRDLNVIVVAIGITFCGHPLPSPSLPSILSRYKPMALVLPRRVESALFLLRRDILAETVARQSLNRKVRKCVVGD